MALYSMSFGFRQPYQVLGVFHLHSIPNSFTETRLLVDSELCKTATEQKLELLKHLGSVLQGTVKLSVFFRKSYILNRYSDGKTVR